MGMQKSIRKAQRNSRNESPWSNPFESLSDQAQQSLKMGWANSDNSVPASEQHRRQLWATGQGVGDGEEYNDMFHQSGFSFQNPGQKSVPENTENINNNMAAAAPGPYGPPPSQGSLYNQSAYGGGFQNNLNNSFGSGLGFSPMSPFNFFSQPTPQMVGWNGVQVPMYPKNQTMFSSGRNWYGGGFKNGGLVRGYQSGGIVEALPEEMMVADQMGSMGVPGGGSSGLPASGVGLPGLDSVGGSLDSGLASMEALEPQMGEMQAGGALPIDPKFDADGVRVGDEDLVNIVVEAKSALEGNHPNPEMAVARFVEVYGEQELKSLMEFVMQEQGINSGTSEMAMGPNDGMSDSVPILASAGEFVVPADAVSHAGNGSTEAGAQSFQSLVDELRSSRTGTTDQAPAIDFNRMVG